MQVALGQIRPYGQVTHRPAPVRAPETTAAYPRPVSDIDAADKELERTTTASVTATLGVVSGTLSRSWTQRQMQAIEPSLSAMDGDEHALSNRLAASEALNVLAARACQAAATTAHAGKRRLLGLIVRDAVLDDAKIDEGLLIERILDTVEAPHIRCLESIHRVEKEAQATGEQGFTARGAEKPLVASVSDEVNRYPPVVITDLIRAGLLSGSAMWDGSAHVPGLTTTGEALLDWLRNAEDDLRNDGSSS